jgi:hypothetical protein
MLPRPRPTLIPIKGNNFEADVDEATSMAMPFLGVLKV